MRSAPTVVPITEFRRDTARIINQMVASGAPVYVTQNGRAAAVLLARDVYEGLLHRLAVQASATPEVGDLSMPQEAQNPGPALVEGAEGHGPAGNVPAGGVPSGSVPSGSVPSGSEAPFRGSSGNKWQLVESRFGLVDAATADFLEAEGYGVEPTPVDNSVAADVGGVAADVGGVAADVGGVAADVGGVAADEVDRRW